MNRNLPPLSRVCVCSQVKSSGSDQLSMLLGLVAVASLGIILVYYTKQELARMVQDEQQQQNTATAVASNSRVSSEGDSTVHPDDSIENGHL